MANGPLDKALRLRRPSHDSVRSNHHNASHSPRGSARRLTFQEHNFRVQRALEFVFVDYGLGVDEADPKKTPRVNWWGTWRKDHSYFMLFAGSGNPIGFSYYDVGDYGDNSTTDKLTVRVFAVP